MSTNAEYPILVRLPAVTVVRAVHPKNAPPPILVRLSAVNSVILVILLGIWEMDVPVNFTRVPFCDQLIIFYFYTITHSQRFGVLNIRLRNHHDWYTDV